MCFALPAELGRPRLSAPSAQMWDKSLCLLMLARSLPRQFHTLELRGQSEGELDIGGCQLGIVWTSLVALARIAHAVLS